jgi:VanZ family protein
VERQPRWKRFAPFLNRRHGFFRAAFHYVEFGLLGLLAIAAATRGTFAFDGFWPWAAWAATCFLAWLDEMHQSRTPGRMFRRIDFLHSLLGATLALAACFAFDIIFRN